MSADTSLDLVAHLRRQRAWSDQTFGPGERTAGVIDHIRKELLEVEAAPTDTSEWIDVAILALDGAMRAGATPEQVAAALLAKQARNEARTWPDWRTMPKDQAIEHVRLEEYQLQFLNRHSDQRPATSDQRPATSDQQPRPGSARIRRAALCPRNLHTGRREP